MRIFESGGGYPSGGSSLMIPCGWSNSYLKMFCDSLEKMARNLSQDGSMVRGALARRSWPIRQARMHVPGTWGDHALLHHTHAQGPDFDKVLAGLDGSSAHLPSADSVVLDAKEGGPVLSVGSK